MAPSKNSTARIQSLFPRSPVWDVETQRQIDAIRAAVYRDPPQTISEIQASSIKPRRLPPDFTRRRDVVAVPPEPDARHAFLDAVQALGPFDHAELAVVPVPLEWVSRASSQAPDTAQGSGTIFHVHGGNLLLSSQGSTASYRPVLSQLAHASGARVVSVEYRLSPQHQLPAAVLDLFVAYLALLYPPTDATWAALDPSQVVFAGDSSGGAILMGLLLVLQQQHIAATSLRFHGRHTARAVPYPSGLAMFSPVGDMLQAMPSCWRHRMHDLFLEPPWMSPSYPACGIWPTTPPSPMLYCRDVDSLAHPLIAPCVWDDWAQFPPLWFGGGQELFYDGAKAMARKAARQGVRIVWLECEAMPHCFFTLPTLKDRPQSALILGKWAEFVHTCFAEPRAAAGAATSRIETVEPDATIVSYHDCSVSRVPLEQPADPPLAAISSLVYDRVAAIKAHFIKHHALGRGKL